MNELESLKKLVAVLRNQRTFAFDKLAEMEVTLIMEREAAAKQAEQAEREREAAAAKKAPAKAGPALVKSINAAIRNGSQLRS